jgi:hypothetical protein
VDSGKWEAIETMAAIAERHNLQYSSTKNNKKYHPGLASHKGFNFTITFAIRPASSQGCNLTVTSAVHPNPSCRPIFGPASPSSKAAIAAPSKNKM